MSEATGELMGHDLHIAREDLTPYYQDVHDQALRAAERTGGLRDLASSIMETNLTLRGQPAERHHQAGHRLGRDHRRPHAHYRILRDERALSRLRRQAGSLPPSPSLP